MLTNINENKPTMAKWKVRIKGIGKMGNDVRQLDKSIEIDEQTMKDLQSSCLYFGHYVKK